MGRSRVLTILFAAGLLATGMSARAATPSSGIVSSSNDALSWSGSFDAIVTPGILAECSLGICDKFTYTVNLAESATEEIEVAVRWLSESTDTDLDLFVTDEEGAVVGQSTGLDSSAEVAHIPVSNGTFDVWVAPVTLDEPLQYSGRIEVESPPAVEPVRDLLPNMTTLEPHTLMIATGEYYIDPVHNEAVSCYPEEITDPDEQTPTRCLRFDQIAYNQGAGPLELRFNPIDPSNAGSPRLRQRIYSSDGTYREVTAEDAMEFHPIHGHWHYSGFGLGRLYVDGNPTPVRQSNKKGFCLIDVDFEGWGAKGNGPRSYSAPGCLVPDPDEGGDVVMGIDNGWADVYNWFLADQFIDITGLADGVYRLEIIADPGNTLVESDYTDNARSTWICISGTTVNKVAGPDAACV
ncbi:MAG: lysyl oxidase family protein [Actinomycetota bacterium]|nr:hypothetical protein [Actinomycetota bacterium]